MCNLYSSCSRCWSSGWSARDRCKRRCPAGRSATRSLADSRRPPRQQKPAVSSLTRRPEDSSLSPALSCPLFLQDPRVNSQKPRLRYSGLQALRWRLWRASRWPDCWLQCSAAMPHCSRGGPGCCSPSCPHPRVLFPGWPPCLERGTAQGSCESYAFRATWCRRATVAMERRPSESGASRAEGRQVGSQERYRRWGVAALALCACAPPPSAPGALHCRAGRTRAGARREWTQFAAAGRRRWPTRSSPTRSLWCDAAAAARASVSAPLDTLCTRNTTAIRLRVHLNRISSHICTSCEFLSLWQCMWKLNFDRAFTELPDVANMAHHEATWGRCVEPRELGVAPTSRLERQPPDERLIEQHSASEQRRRGVTSCGSLANRRQ